MGAKSLKFARRREGATDYKKRFNLLKSCKPRLVIRQTNKKIIAQVIVFTEAGDKVIASALSSELSGFGWKHSVKSVTAAYLTGMIIGLRAKGKNVDDCIVDLGLKTITKGSRIFAVLRGALDGGLIIPHSPENLPGEDRISGKHIAAYRKTDISKDFGEMKAKLASSKALAAPKKQKAHKKAVGKTA